MPPLRQPLIFVIRDTHQPNHGKSRQTRSSLNYYRSEGLPSLLHALLGSWDQRQGSPVLMEVQFVVDPFHTVSLLLGLPQLASSTLGIANAQHPQLALVDPLVEEEIGQLDVLPLVLKTPDDHALDEGQPVGDPLHQSVSLSEQSVPLENRLFDFL